MDDARAHRRGDARHRYSRGLCRAHFSRLAVSAGVDRASNSHMADPSNTLSDRNLEASTTLSLTREPACFAFQSSRAASAPRPIDAINLDLASSVRAAQTHHRQPARDGYFLASAAVTHRTFCFWVPHHPSSPSSLQVRRRARRARRAWASARRARCGTSPAFLAVARLVQRTAGRGGRRRGGAAVAARRAAPMFPKGQAPITLRCLGAQAL